MSALKALPANQVIAECASTNDLARELAERGYPHGTWISARRQVSGRGRQGRRWEGIDGNLFLSIVIRISPSRVWSWVPLAAAVGVATALREYNPGLDVRIKWPNDLWLGSAKLGGVLCEAVGSPEGSFIVVGIGLNCTGSPKGLDQATSSLSESLGMRVTADEIRTVVIQEVLETFSSLEALGVEPVVRVYERWAALEPGTRIEWGQIPQRRGRVQGLGPSGELLVCPEEGGLERIFAEDVKVRVDPKAFGGSPA